MYSYRVLLVYFITIICVRTEEDTSLPMSDEERLSLKEEARRMFYHAYDAYMDNAFPADELMPLSCKGRWRGITPSRGDLDDVLGNYSLTLVDSLDTLVVLGDFTEFSRAVRLVIENVRFDSDIVVSVFETNIRVLGGLLSAHILAMELQREDVPCMRWYTDELLRMAEDLGNRLLPAFNTTTGIPYGRINLLRGMEGVPHSRETCTACAGTMILEFAALSRLSGNTDFEQKAAIAMDILWKTRHRTSDLMGTTIDVYSGDWVRKDSSVGAGIDSYYEYCLKAYILLGDEKYLFRFIRHYNAVMKYISRGPLMLAVYMHRPHLQSRNFMDSLLAFWPGLQVLMGDVRPAVETHEMLHQVMRRHTFIPEAFTSDFQVHWGQHPLRPEFLESTLYLHRATGDAHYLQVGKTILRALQQHARVPCGYAAVNDVRTRNHEDRMDSFVLAETFKYLYMLFGEDKDLPIKLERFVMTTEAHFLPLTLAHSSNNSRRIVELDDEEDKKYTKTCPNTASLEPKKVREPMRQMVGSTAARPPARLRPLNDPRQIHALAEMGISVLTLPDGRVQLLYTTSTAKSPNEAAEGLTFMREMSKWNTMSDTDNGVQLLGISINSKIYAGGPAHFGKEIVGDIRYEGTLALVNPPNACSDILNKPVVENMIGVAYRGECTFAQKVRFMQDAGAKAAIIIDNKEGTSYENTALFAMSNDGKEDVKIPALFLYSEEGKMLLSAIKQNPDVSVTLADFNYLKNSPGDCNRQDVVSTVSQRSFDHLKDALSQLVEQIQQSLTDEGYKKRDVMDSMSVSIPNIIVSKDKFVVKNNQIIDPFICDKESPGKIKLIPSDLDSDDLTNSDEENSLYEVSVGEEKSYTDSESSIDEINSVDNKTLSNQGSNDISDMINSKKDGSIQKVINQLGHSDGESSSSDESTSSDDSENHSDMDSDDEATGDEEASKENEANMARDIYNNILLMVPDSEDELGLGDTDSDDEMSERQKSIIHYKNAVNSLIHAAAIPINIMKPTEPLTSDGESGAHNEGSDKVNDDKDGNELHGVNDEAILDVTEIIDQSEIVQVQNISNLESSPQHISKKEMSDNGPDLDKDYDESVVINNDDVNVEVSKPLNDILISSPASEESQLNYVLIDEPEKLEHVIEPEIPTATEEDTKDFEDVARTKDDIKKELMYKYIDQDDIAHITRILRDLHLDKIIAQQSTEKAVKEITNAVKGVRIDFKMFKTVNFEDLAWLIHKKLKDEFNAERSQASAYHDGQQNSGFRYPTNPILTVRPINQLSFEQILAESELMPVRDRDRYVSMRLKEARGGQQDTSVMHDQTHGAGESVSSRSADN